MNNKIMAMVVVAIIVVAGVGAYYVLSDNGNDDGGIDLVSSGNYLKIFGNANGDDILDSKDVEIIQRCGWKHRLLRPHRGYGKR